MSRREQDAWTSRPCRDCGLVCPRSEFERPDPRLQSGITTIGRCRDCHRRRSREYQKMRWQDDNVRKDKMARHRRYLERVAADVKHRRDHYCAKHRWVGCRCQAHLTDAPHQAVVYLLPFRPSIRVPRADRPWIGRQWTWRATNGDRMPPPRFGVPIVVLDGAVAITHPSCPDEWRWVAPIVHRWRQRHLGLEPAA